MATTANSRKLLARLEARSLSLADSKPPRSNIGTAADARLHSPPRTPEWKRIASAIELLREGLRKRPGPSRIHCPTPTRSLRDPDATENIDVAAGLGFAVGWVDDRKQPPQVLRRQLAISVYSFRNWRSFAEQNAEKMIGWVRAWVSAVCTDALEHKANWINRAVQHKHYGEVITRVADAALVEFMQPNHCEFCHGHGTEQTGARVGSSCGECGGAGIIPWSGNQRAKAVRVRKQDWSAIWSIPYLQMLDKLQALERRGAELHARGLGDEE